VLAGAVSAGVHAQNDDLFPSYAVGVSLNVPLWDGGGSSAEASIARARAEELAARMHELRTEREYAAARAELSRQHAEQRLARAQALLEVATQRLRETEERYELGAGGIEALAQARSVLRGAQGEVVLAQLARADAILMAGPRTW
jgi:outer membrane protein TolC